MGQKVNPVGFRVGVNRAWPSRWFARRHNYADLLLQDLKVRNYINNKLSNAEISEVEIEKTGNNIRIILHSGRPGIVIGKKGHDIEALRRDLAKLVNKPGQSQQYNVEVTVQEVATPDLDATLIAKNIAEQIEKRVGFKKAIKKGAMQVMRAGARGVKVNCAGRLGGAEIARDEKVQLGSLPLQTLRSNIDYALAEAKTTYGIIGIKVWIYRGEYNNKAK